MMNLTSQKSMLRCAKVQRIKNTLKVEFRQKKVCISLTGLKTGNI